jgi:tRNA threonylcarbamoyladenosine biosynthesis protein TsaE
MKIYIPYYFSYISPLALLSGNDFMGSTFMKLEVLTKNSSQTKKIGEILAKEILSMRKAQPSPSARGMRMRPCEFLGIKKQALVIGLEGDLGGGKTTFLQGFARGLGIKQKILSPTFIIMRKFKIPIRVYSLSNSRRFASFYHIDCYRIGKLKEILDLGFKEIISNPKNIVAIEWADRIGQIIPKETFWIKFEIVNKNQRKIMLTYKGKLC